MSLDRCAFLPKPFRPSDLNRAVGELLWTMIRNPEVGWKGIQQMQLGCSLPVADIGTGPSVLSDYAQAAEGAFAKLRTLTQDAGRDPSAMGLGVWVSPGAGDEEDWRREITFWKEAGVTHVTAHTTYVSGHHKRIAGHSAAEHLAAITRYHAAVADLL